MIATICMFDAILCHYAIIEYPEINSGFFVCYFKLHKLLMWCVPMTLPKQTATNILLFCHEILFMYFQLASLNLNLSLCLDLI